jgi:tetratricopeptide (TPR) repeat protein
MILLALALLAADPACAAGPAGAQCRAVAASTAGRFAEAAAGFEDIAASATGPVRDRAYAAAGNMWLAAGEPGKAALALDRALAGSGLQAEQRGEALLDRARVAAEQGNLKLARAKAKEAEASISADPFLWYFSSALALRELDLPAAETAVNRGLSLAPGEALMLFQAGHVAHAKGDEAGARDYWTRAAAAEPASPTGKAAKEALALLTAPRLPK